MSINGVATGFIAGFYLLPDGRIASDASELSEIGLKPEGAAKTANGRVIVDGLPGVTYKYDAALQTIDFTADDKSRIVKDYNAQARNGNAAAESGFGTVLNYGAYAAASGAPSNGLRGTGFDGASITFDHRVYSRCATLSNSAIVGQTPGNGTTALRLNTQISATNSDFMVTGAAGDTISGALPWTRPIRLGGVQLRRNFDVRPDLVTMPLPSVSGSAAVPSTVDVYVGSMKTYSQQVGSGPFTISNIPVIDGSGNARVVVRDATGRESESVTPFSTSSDLLKPGLFDYAIDAGVARTAYGQDNLGYEDDPLGLASLRYGITDIFTGEAHAEAGAGVLNGGLGGVVALGHWGLASGAAAGSYFEGDSGLQLHGSFETTIAGVNLQASTTRTLGSYRDLAYAASLQKGMTRRERAALAPARAQDQIGASFQLPEGAGNMGLGALHVEDAEGDHNFFLTANYSRALPRNAMMTLSGYMALGGPGDAGVSLGLSAPLGENGYATASASMDKGSQNYTASYAKARGNEDGSVGWQAQATAGDRFSGQAQVSYRAAVADTQLNVSGNESAAQGNAYAEGAAVMANGGVFLSRRIDDAFAIVDTGVPNVPVEFENRPAGVSNSSGKLLVPGLHAYQENRIAIVPDGLPIDADYDDTQQLVVPSKDSGVLVSFGVRRNAAPALVTFVAADGSPIPPGTPGQLMPAGEAFVVGYDGQAYIKKLGATNVVELQFGSGRCTARFDYAPKDGEQVMIKGVVCS